MKYLKGIQASPGIAMHRCILRSRDFRDQRRIDSSESAEKRASRGNQEQCLRISQRTGRMRGYTGKEQRSIRRHLVIFARSMLLELYISNMKNYAEYAFWYDLQNFCVVNLKPFQRLFEERGADLWHCKRY